MIMVWSFKLDFQFRNKLNLKSLPKNHLMKLDSLNFDFVEYKVIDFIKGKLGCFLPHL